VLALPLATLVVASGALSGCGGQPPAALRGTPQAVVRAAADRTMALGGAHVEVSVASDLAGAGTVDLAHGSGQLTLARAGAGAHLGDHFDVRVSGATEWLNVTGPGGGAPGTSPARPWLAGSPLAVTQDSYTRVKPLESLLVRPGLATDLAFLRGAERVAPYGGEEVRGVNTYHYTFVVDLPTAIAASPAAERPELEAAAAAIGPIQWPADVWLDAQGRVRRLQVAEDPKARTTTTKGNLFITEDGNIINQTTLLFSDFGTPAVFSAPDAALVVSLPGTPT